MANRKPHKKAKPDPSEEVAERIQRAAAASLKRDMRPSVVWEGKALAAPHNDGTGHWAELLNMFGTRSGSFVSTQLGTLEACFRGRGDTFPGDPDLLNSALAVLGAIAPQNELEGALAVQMAGVHALSCDLMTRTKQTDRTDHMALYGNLAVKLTRTFAAQTEALAKMRGGTKQQVEVRYVYVNGDAIIGDVQQGGGGKTENGHQPHAPCLEASAGASMPGPLPPLGKAVPGSRDQGEEALPHARRE